MIDNSSHHFDVPNCSEEKDLGILFEDSLKFNKHVANSVFRCNRLIGLIKRSFQFMTKKLFIALYKSLLRSVIDYGCIVWFPSTKKNSQLIENIQRRATGLVSVLKGLSYHQRLKELNLSTILYRRKRYDMIQIFKLIHGFDDYYYNKLFQFNVNCTRGHIYHLQTPRCMKSLRLNAFPAFRMIFGCLLSEKG